MYETRGRKDHPCIGLEPSSEFEGLCCELESRDAKQNNICGISFFMSPTGSGDGDFQSDSCRVSVDSNAIDVDQGGHDDAPVLHHHHEEGRGMMAMLEMSGKMIMNTIKPLMNIAKMINPLRFVS